MSGSGKMKPKCVFCSFKNSAQRVVYEHVKKEHNEEAKVYLIDFL